VHLLLRQPCWLLLLLLLLLAVAVHQRAAACLVLVPECCHLHERQQHTCSKLYQ
jgi:hypothetical protein